jgi:DNA-binding transcriptional MerR regulator
MEETEPSHSIRELAAITDTKVRTLRRWVHTGAISSTDFRGPATSYGARHVDEARAVKRLLGENLSLEAIRARLTRMSDAELARFVRPEPIASVVSPGPREAALQGAPLGVEAMMPVAMEPVPGAMETTYAGERWEHVTLLPGLKLLVRSDSSALVLRIAQEIHARYGAGKS